MTTPVIAFEDFGWQRLLPLVYMRPTFQLLCGMDHLISKISRLAGVQTVQDDAPETSEPRHTPAVEVWCRPGLAEIATEQTGFPANGPCRPQQLLLNGRGLWRQLPDRSKLTDAWVGTAGPHAGVACIFADEVLARKLTPTTLLDEAQMRAALAGIPRFDVSQHVTLFDWPWEIVLANEKTLIADWEECIAGKNQLVGQVAEGAYLLAPESIHIGAGTRVKPCAVIDAEDGPVWIGENVTIFPHSYVQGPALIGDGCLLQPGAVVHAGTTIGPRSKIGGEVEASIVQGFSNKQHDGFLGHSYVGSWVNIAADCINSDLKNTYGNIRVPINGREVDTGEMFAGMLVGDYSKAGINVSFPTGAVIGFCSSVFAPQSPKFVPSFAWIDNESAQRYDETRGVALARKVMARRNRIMSDAEERAFLAVRQLAMAIEHQPQVELERDISHSRNTPRGAQ